MRWVVGEAEVVLEEGFRYGIFSPMSSESLPCHSLNHTGHLWFHRALKTPSFISGCVLDASFLGAWVLCLFGFYFFFWLPLLILKSQMLPRVYISLIYSGQQWSGLLWSTSGSFPLLTMWKCFENCSSVYTCMLQPFLRFCQHVVIFHEAGHWCENTEVGIWILSFCPIIWS